MKDFVKLDLATLVVAIITCVILFAPATIYADDPEKEDIHFLQEVFRLKGMYNGYIDGIAGPETIKAVRLYKEQKGLDVTDQISDQLIDMLREEAEQILPYIAPEQPNDLDNEGKLAAITHELNKTKEDLNSLKTHLSALESKMGDHFISNFINLALLFVGISAIAATTFSIWLGWYIPSFQEKITKKVEQTHREMLTKTEDHISAKVLLNISSHCINLYKDIDTTKNERLKKLYDSYLQIAKNISIHGYKRAKSLKNNAAAKLTNTEKNIIDWSVNNLLFYITTPFFHEKGIISDTDIRKIYDELKEIYESYKEDTNENLWWEFKDTLFWAEYHMKYRNISDIVKDINQLMKNTHIPYSSRYGIYKRYSEIIMLNNNHKMTVELNEPIQL